MSTGFTWSTRLLDAEGNAAAGASLAVELFDLAANKWAALSQAVTGTDGNVRGRGEIADDTVPFAPALRLLEAGAVMATTTNITRAARGLNVDFGEVRRAPVATPFIRTIGRGGSPFTIGGARAATAAIDLAAVRAEVSRDFTTQLAENVRVVGEKDAEISRLFKLVTARDEQIITLRQPSAPVATVDAATIRAEVTRDFTARLAAKDLEVIDQIKVRDAKVEAATKLAADKDIEITRLAEVIADKDRILANPRPGVAAVAGITRVTDFASTIGMQLDEAQTALKSRGFSLGSIEVNAKALLQDEGRKIEILDREMMKTIQPGMLSDFKLNYRPDKPPPEVQGQLVPDLMFLTENRARAVLASLGLLLEASTGPAAINAQAATGQAMLQTPAPGDDVPRGGRVHVIFAAPKE